MNLRLLHAVGILVLCSSSLPLLSAQSLDPVAPIPEASGAPQSSGPTSQPGGYRFPDAHERFHTYVGNMVSPFMLVYTAGRAGISHLWDDPAEWRGDFGGYGQRLASSFGTSLVKRSMEYGFNEALHLDSKYYRCSCQGFLPRLGHAMKSTITARNREGRTVFSAPVLASNYAAEVLATTTWYPDRYSYRDGLRDGNWALLGRFGFNIVREFVFRR